MFYADLHLHSHYSDGSDSIIQIIQKAKVANLKAIAITDHDTFCQHEKYKALEKEYEIKIIPALELSCQDAITQKKVHILAYNIDSRARYTKELVEKFKNHVNTIRYLMVKSIPFLNLDELLKQIHSPILYKQQIALNIASKKEISFLEAYNMYFRGENRLDETFKVTFMDVQEVIEAINKDGGIPVLAHPYSYKSVASIERYISYGLKGIECSHPSYKNHNLDEIEPLIQKYHLLKTGGSDYHGSLSLSDARQIGNYGINYEDYLKLKEQLL